MAGILSERGIAKAAARVWQSHAQQFSRDGALDYGHAEVGDGFRARGPRLSDRQERGTLIHAVEAEGSASCVLSEISIHRSPFNCARIAACLKVGRDARHTLDTRWNF